MSINKHELLLTLVLVLITSIHSSLVFRIIGGQVAEEGLAPYQVSLQTLPGSHLCGAAILKSQWIVTAAHCVAGWPPTFLRVAAGSNSFKSPRSIFYVDQIHLHCHYDQPKYHNDLALLHVNSSIDFNDFIKPIELPTAMPLQITQPLLLTGWGLISLWDPFPEKLQKLQMYQVDMAKCIELLKDFDDVSLDVSHLCAYAERYQGACHGDNGGPLVWNNTLVGVHSWSYPCADGYPDVFVNIWYYREWLRLIMSGNSRCYR